MSSLIIQCSHACQPHGERSTRRDASFVRLELASHIFPLSPAPTMATTRKSNGKLAPSKRAAAAPDSDSDGFEAEQHARPKKRVKTRKGSQGTDDDEEGNTPAVVAKPRNPRRKLGRLAMMMSMPIDVFCEIARYLGPHDLLRMARTSRTLRNLLMTKDSKPIWRAAEDSVGLPECPLDLSSPQYASFVFDAFCTHCFHAKAYKQLTPLRIRLCKECTTFLSRADSWVYNDPDMPRNDEERSCVLRLVNGLSTTSPPIKALDYSNLRSFMFYDPQVTAAVAKYRSFDEACRQREGFLDAENDETVQRYLSSPALDRWLENTKVARSNDIQNARDSRLRSIYNKLTALGYTQADYRTDGDQKDWKWNSLIDQPRPLTDRIWKNILPQLEETIRLRREKRARIAKERRRSERRYKLRKLAEKFVCSESGKTCYVAPVELYKQPLARQFVESDEEGTALSEAQWLSIKQQVVEFSKVRQREIEEEAASALVAARREAGLPAISAISIESSEGKREVQAGEGKSVSVLQHPTAFFGSRDLKPFTGILDERHDYCHKEFDCARGERWVLRQPARNGVLYADALYSELGLPSTTMNDMLALGESFVCLRCDPTVRTLMTWIDLVNHFYNENDLFEKREAVRKRRTDCEVVNINDHDRIEPEPLAAYTGDITALRDGTLAAASLSELEKWIQACTCETHDGKSFQSCCASCFKLGQHYLNLFSCQGQMDVHRRAKHTARTD
ncbi:hypothetical protein DFH11DRAFT_1141796 [Phellopilus nigrolimitatus]|nr:hypothetical protein DFH11DRAFT_1141796 [Phellopilus nigrolimitatus]